MLNGYTTVDGTLNKIDIRQSSDLTPEMVWIDLSNPTEQERQWVKQAYGQELQFMEELDEIEASARYYRDEFGLHINQYFLLTDKDVTRNVNVAFTLNQGRLFTLRGEELPVFRTFYSKASKNPEYCCGAVELLLGLIATRIGMMADLYEKLQAELEPVTRVVIKGDAREIPQVLDELTRIEDINGKARLGLIENKRAYPHLLRCPEAAGNTTAVNEILADVESLTNHSNFLAERTKFLMDAAMGTMNIAFNGRLNTFTVLSVVLMPPMLVVSIYGMNFEHMPELKWIWGYPMALLLALASAIGPFLYLKHKKWL
jgi:magnesium transporter